MTVLAVEFDVCPPTADVFRHGFVEIQRLAQLIEISDLQVGAVFDDTRLWLEFAEQQSQ